MGHILKEWDLGEEFNLLLDQSKLIYLVSVLFYSEECVILPVYFAFNDGGDDGVGVSFGYQSGSFYGIPVIILLSRLIHWVLIKYSLKSKYFSYLMTEESQVKPIKILTLKELSSLDRKVRKNKKIIVDLSGNP